MCKYFISLLLLFSGITVFSQEKNQEKKKEEKNVKLLQITPPKEKIKVSGISIGTDLLLPTLAILNGKQTAYELNTALLLNNKYFIIADAGYAAIRREGNIGGIYTYKNAGNYFRIGLDYNFFHKKLENEVLFAGFRLCQAYYNHSLDYTLTDTIYGVQQGSTTNDKQNFIWGELTGGIKVMIVKNLFLSALVRIKIRASDNANAILLTNDVPGFGANAGSSNLFFGYQLLYRIPFR
jgi:hypothetical protein